MNSRERFVKTLNYANADRVPLFMEGIRDDVIASWQREGMDPGTELEALFTYDDRIEISPELDPRPRLKNLPRTDAHVTEFTDRLDPEDVSRLPGDWDDRVRQWSSQENTMMLFIYGTFRSKNG